MLPLNDIHKLASRPRRPEKSVLTVYLDIDQSKQPNLNRGFETALKDLLAGLKANIDNQKELNEFDAACEHVRGFVEQAAVGARGLVLVFDCFDRFFWFQGLRFPVSNRARWDREVFVEPLAAALDEYERVGIVLLDRANLRLFTMYLGELEEHSRQGFDQKKVRHTKTVGMNNLGAAGHAQQKADEEVRINLRHMIKQMDNLVAQAGIQRLILAGSLEMTAQFRTLLPKRLASRVIGTVHLPIDASSEAILNATVPVAEQFERETEEALVTDLVTSRAKQGGVALGLAHTLHALNQGRLWQLVYSKSFHGSGYECTACGALFSSETLCSICGAPVHPVEDVVERAVDHAISKGVKIEVIRAEKAESDLTNVGGIGAFLRTRRATARVS